MCRPYQLTRRNSSRIINRPPNQWINTATCCIIRSYYNSDNRNYLCVRCYNEQKDEINLRLYPYLIRHYLRVGPEVEVEACSECERVIVRERSINSCRECPLVLTGFINHLVNTRDEPYNQRRAVTVAVLEIISLA